MKVIKMLKSIFGFRERIPNYPGDFAIITFSSTALGEGIEDDQNKMIIRYSYDKFGNLIEKKIRYSKERVQALKMIHRIPLLDKTEEGRRFPVYSRSLPGEIEYGV